ncbi:hypothetical protein Tco_0702483 [Tanacetum coccineum]|uniref:Synaptobrevin, longin-like domain protein n=1 Tax=Tanacetum coccineum TaxID=301880 RepID=A0ABQ4XXX1_9ASTR
MASLKFVDQHNMVACLEKSEENTEFHQIVDFLSTCSINYALTVSPTIYASYIEQFWNTATSKTVNSVKQIHAIVNDRAVVISESSVRNDLLFDDEDGITCLTNDEIFENLALMGYEQLSTKLTFQKGSFSPQWKFLIHTILHCISSKSTAWNEFSTNLASAVICLAKGQKFNFSKLIFDGMLRNLDPKKFLMYPRFLQLFLNNQLKDLPEPFNDTYETPCHTKKVFTNMARKGVKFSGKVTPLFDSMLVPHQAPEGEGSEQPTEPQPTPSPTHPSTGDQPPVTDSSSSHDTTQDSRDSLEDTNGSEGTQVQSSHDSPLSGDHTSKKAEGGLNLEELFVLCTNLSNRVLALETSKDTQVVEILKLKDQIKKLKRKCKPSILHHRAWLKSVKMLSMKKRLGRKEYVSKQGRKNAKLEPTLEAFDDLDADDRDYMETEDVVKEGRQSNETEELNKGSGDKGGNVDAARQEDGAMKEEKAKEKGVSIKDIEYSSRPARSILTLKPLPIIDPKDKGKSVLEEPKPNNEDDYNEANTFAKIQGLYERQKRVIDDFKPMDSDDAVKDSKEAAGVLKQKTDADLEEEEQLKAFLKIVPNEEGIIDYEVLEKRFPIINRESKFYDFDRHGAECIYYRIFRFDGSSRWIKTFSDTVTRFDRLDLVELYNLAMKRFETTTPKGVDLVLWGDLRTMFDANAEDELWQNQERWNLKSWDLYENCGVYTLILEDGTEMHMLAERKYPLTKETLERMLSLRLVARTTSEDAYTQLRFIQKQINEYGSHDGGEKDL